MPPKIFRQLLATLFLAATSAAHAGEPAPVPVSFKLSPAAWKAQCPQITRSTDVWKDGDLPQFVRQPPPRYPIDMLNQEKSGSVTFDARIDTAGNIVDLQIKRATDEGFVQPAAKTIWQWMYQPVRYDGKPTCVEADIDITFRID